MLQPVIRISFGLVFWGVGKGVVWEGGRLKGESYGGETWVRVLSW